MDDCVVCYAMNGEPLRPQQGFPLRLMVPGFEGIYEIKYRRRIKVVDSYYMTYDDYGHINPDTKKVRCSLSRRGARDATGQRDPELMPPR